MQGPSVLWFLRLKSDDTASACLFTLMIEDVDEGA